MALVVQHLKVFKLVVKDRSRFAFDLERGISKGRAAELQVHLFVVVAVNVAVATGPDEVAHIEIALLRHHVREPGVAGNVEGHTQKDVSTALVQLAAELGFFARVLCRCHVELKKRMAGHERHLVEFGHVPRAHNDAAAIGVALECVDDLLNLIDMAAIGLRPAAPLHTVDRTEVSIFAGPFVPNGDVTFFEPIVVARACEEPKQFLNDGAQMNLFGGHQWKAFIQIKAHLVAENAFGACARAVGFGNTMGVDVLHKIFVLAADGAHRGHSGIAWLSLRPGDSALLILKFATLHGVLT